jgi:hypothetical protein
MAAMFVNGSRQNEQSLQRTFHRCFQPSFGSFDQAISEENISFFFRNLTNQKQELPCLLTDQDEMITIYRRHISYM